MPRRRNCDWRAHCLVGDANCDCRDGGISGIVYSVGGPSSSALVPLPVAIYAGRIRVRRNKALLGMLLLQSFYECGVERLEGRMRSRHDSDPSDFDYLVKAE